MNIFRAKDTKVRNCGGKRIKKKENRRKTSGIYSKKRALEK